MALEDTRLLLSLPRALGKAALGLLQDRAALPQLPESPSELSSSKWSDKNDLTGVNSESGEALLHCFQDLQCGSSAD